MSRIRRDGVADGPRESEGGRSPSGLFYRPERHADRLGSERAADVGPALEREPEVVLRPLGSEAAEDLSRELGVPLYKLERWRQKAEAALDGALKEPIASMA